MIELKCTFDQKKKDCVARFMACPESRYLYGRTRESASIARQLEVEGFIDDFTTETQHLGKPVLKLQDVPKDAIVVSTVVMARPVTALKNLQRHHIEAVDYFAFLKLSGLKNLATIPYWEGARQHFSSYHKDYQDLYKNLADTESRQVFDMVLNFRLNHDLSYMLDSKLNLEGMYFEPFINIQRSKPVFFDIGCFDGYNSDHFLRIHQEMDSAFLFEPNPQQASMLREKYKGDPRFKIMEYAITDRDGTVYFDADLTASHISQKDSGLQVKTTSLDLLFSETAIIPDFIKMDIEGSELLALEGARALICNHLPNLAISVYHDASHLTEAYRLIRQFHSSYRFYLRHYTEGYIETVLFAIPGNV